VACRIEATNPETNDVRDKTKVRVERKLNLNLEVDVEVESF